jgi:hypothetical protein
LAFEEFGEAIGLQSRAVAVGAGTGSDEDRLEERTRTWRVFSRFSFGFVKDITLSIMGKLATRLITAFLLFTSGVSTAVLSTVSHTHPRERLLQRPVAREEVGKSAGPAEPEGELPRLYMVLVRGKTGFINRTGKLVIAPKFDLMWFPHAWSGEEEDFSEGMARIKVDAGRSPLTTFTKYLNGFIDMKGNVRIPPQYEEAEDFSEGLAAVKVSTWREGYNTTKDRYGYIDKAGRMAIPARFYVAGSFSEGLANVCEEGAGCGYIDHTGRMVLPLPFSGFGEFRDGMASVLTSTGNDGIIDRTGRLIYEGSFPSLRRRWFYEGLAAVHFGERMGFIDKAGRTVIKPVYDSAGDFSEGLAPVKVGGKYGYIDKSGVMVIAPQFDTASGFSNGLAVIGRDGRRGYLDRKYGYIDKLGSIVSKPRFYMADSFSEGLAEVEVRDGGGRITCGYIDTAGRMVIKPRFLSAYRFSGGIAMVKPTFHTMAYLDKTGRYVWGPSR